MNTLKPNLVNSEASLYSATDMSRILVIDDEEVFREVMALTLRRKGFETSEAPDGEQGTELARRQSPDLILCDLHMEPLDGYATLQRLRKDPVTATIPFMLMTAEVSEFGATILQSAERLHRTVQNFLLYGQLEMQAADPQSAAALRAKQTDGLGALVEQRARHYAERAGRTADLQLAVSDGT